MKPSLLFGSLLVLSVVHAAEPARSISLVLKFENGQYEIMDAKTSSTPVHEVSASRHDVQVVVSSSSGATVYRSWMDDPTRKHGPMPLPNEPQTGHVTFHVSSTAVMLKIPYDARSAKLQIIPISSTSTSARKTTLDSAVSTLDLTAVMSGLNGGRRLD